MNGPQICLTADSLHQLAHDEFSPAAMHEIEQHVTECPRCRELLEGAESDAQWREDIYPVLRSPMGSLQVDDDRAEPASEDFAGESLDVVLPLLSPTDDPRMLGRIGSYEVVGVVGRGGMGVVFKAFDAPLNRYVAIKLLLPHLAASAAARKRFAREGQAAAAVIDDHVMPIYSVAEWQGIPYLVTQYCGGVTLQKRIEQQGPLEVTEILRIAVQTARGLAAAHAQGLVHRDVKPSNILLDGTVERAMLTDFGLARAVDDASITRTGVIAGTPQYMSPEQARGGSVDARSDLFGLGCVLYAMSAGRPPFRADNSHAILRLITDEEPRPIRAINPEIPEWLCAIIAKLMSKQPDDRFASAAEVADLLEDCLAHVQQPTSVPLPADVQPRSAGKLDLSKSATRRWTPARVIAAAVCVVMLLFAGIVIVLETGKGTLTITCEADDVPIRIMQDDGVVDHLTVSHAGKTVRVAAGSYRVEIDGNVDGIAVADGTVTLQRGGRETVRIVRKDQAKTARNTGSEKVQLEALPDGNIVVRGRTEDVQRAIEHLQRTGSPRLLFATRRNVQLRRARLLQTRAPDHPDVRQVDAEIKALEDQMKGWGIAENFESAQQPRAASGEATDTPRVRQSPEVARAAQALRETLRERLEFMQVTYAGGKSSLSELLAAVEEFAAADQAAAASEDARRLASRRHVEVLKQLSNDVDAKYQAGLVSRADLLAVQAAFIKAEALAAKQLGTLGRDDPIAGSTLAGGNDATPGTADWTPDDLEIEEAMLIDPQLRQAVDLRDEALKHWQAVKLRYTSGEVTAGEEAAARERFFRRRAEMHAALKTYYDQKADLVSLNVRVRRLLLQLATQSGTTVSDDEVQAEKARIADKFGLSVVEFERMIENERGVTAEQWGTDLIKPYLLMRKLAGGEAHVGAFYEQLRSQPESEFVPGDRGKLTIQTADASASDAVTRFRFPAELEGDWRIASAMTGGHARDEYAGQLAEIRGNVLTLRSRTAANAYFLTFVDPSDDHVALDLTAYPPGSDRSRSVTFQCIMSIAENKLRLCRPQRPSSNRPQDLESPERSATVFTLVRDDNDSGRPAADTWQRAVNWLQENAPAGITEEHMTHLKQRGAALEKRFRKGNRDFDDAARTLLRDVLAAELELAASAEERIGILEKHVALLKDLERVLTTLHKAGKSGLENVQAAQADRTEAEKRLAREREASSGVRATEAEDGVPPASSSQRAPREPATGGDALALAASTPGLKKRQSTTVRQ